MPIYHYICRDCDKHFDAIRKFSEMDTPMECPECHKEAERQLTTFGHYTPIKNNGASVRPKGVAKGSK